MKFLESGPSDISQWKSTRRLSAMCKGLHPDAIRYSDICDVTRAILHRVPGSTQVDLVVAPGWQPLPGLQLC